MRAVLTAVVLATLVGGCVGGTAGGPGNPNLIAPKLLVQPRPDGNVTLFVHGAFRDQSYEWVAIAIDNETVLNRTRVFSAEHDAPGPGFFVEVSAQALGQLYDVRARLDVNQTGERLRVSILSEKGWSDARAYGVPYEHLLDHLKEAP